MQMDKMLIMSHVNASFIIIIVILLLGYQINNKFSSILTRKLSCFTSFILKS